MGTQVKAKPDFISAFDLGKLGQSKFMAPGTTPPAINSAFGIGNSSPAEWGGAWNTSALEAPPIATPNWFASSPTPTVGPIKGAKPELKGNWMEGIGTGLEVAKVGLGIYNAVEQSKMNDFMKGYYGDQIDMQRTDFANAAKSTNAALEQRAQNKAAAAGFTFDSAENKSRTAADMAKWGVNENF